ncbi:hypothetical protein RHMOL_Rhmol04G0156700 [Rhododendron molle]|uniref:Uncharacterized protein n=1 Tax=Rhododendron molle TaxID=49168 RepID=A0ACC0P106_RHOML|nr:hypothetical protein RHMOL_Rhmol04G0156700 [Rhododendron molle]
MVRGVSSLERDRQQKRLWHQALAPLWGNFFNFKLISSLVDNADHSIFGAIYEFKSPPPYGHRYNPCQSPPRYVVAFSGTMINWDTRKQDLTLDAKIILNTLEQSPRFQIAMQVVHDTVSIAEPQTCGVPVKLTTKTEILKCRIRFTASVMKAGVTTAQHVLRERPQMDDWFAPLSAWTPYLFVHPSDPVSAEYVGYFEHREWMVKIGAGAIERLAARNSISDAYQPLHLLPSAHLIVNLSPAQNYKQAHGLEQWWKPNIQCQLKLHEFSD